MPFSFFRKIAQSLVPAQPGAAEPVAAAATPTDVGTTSVLQKVDEESIRKALGGDANVKSMAPIAVTRLRVEVGDMDAVDAGALTQAGVVAVATVAANTLHLIVGIPAE